MCLYLPKYTTTDIEANTQLLIFIDKLKPSSSRPTKCHDLSGFGLSRCLECCGFNHAMNDHCEKSNSNFFFICVPLCLVTLFIGDVRMKTNRKTTQQSCQFKLCGGFWKLHGKSHVKKFKSIYLNWWNFPLKTENTIYTNIGEASFSKSTKVLDFTSLRMG